MAEFDKIDQILWGNKGAHPSTAAALYQLNLITQEQALAAANAYAEEWEDAWNDARWWRELSYLAYKTLPKRKRWFTLSYFKWTDEWIKEKRGW